MVKFNYEFLLQAGGNPHIRSAHRCFGINLDISDVAVSNGKLREIENLIEQTSDVE